MNLITVKEFAGRLSVSVQQVYRLINDGAIPVVNVGKRCYRLDEEDVARFLEKRREQKCQSSGIELGHKPERTLVEAMTRWAEEELPTMKSEAAARSHAAQLLPYLGGYKLDQVHECAAEYVRKHKDLKAATIYQRLAILRRIANLAYKKWGWVSASTRVRSGLWPS